MNLEKYIPRLTGRTGEFRKPLKMMAFWTDTTRTSDGQPAMRGFGGRLMFFDRHDGKPVKVAGTLVIYAFDEAHGEGDNPLPDRKYVFTPDQFAKHYSKSELGHSYSVWIPWDRVGGETKEIGLICRFTPVEGGAVVSEQVRQALPGVTPAAAPTTAVVDVRRFDSQATDANGQKMLTTTIDLNGPPERRFPTALARPRPDWSAVIPQVATPGNAASTTPSAANPAGAATDPKSTTAGQAASGPATTATTVSAQERSGSWLAHFGQHQSRVPGAPLVVPDRSRGPWRPSHVIPPTVPPTTPTTSLTQAAANNASASQQ